MLSSNRNNGMVLDPVNKVRESSPVDAALDALERLGRELHACDKAVPQIQQALQAVHDGLNCDAVIWCPLPLDETVEVVGRVSLTPDWCRRFVQELFDASGGSDSEILTNRFESAFVALPASAAMVRLSRSRATWLVAVNFQPSRPFTKTDLKLLVLARRLLLNQHASGQSHEKLKEALFGLIHCLTATLDAKDPNTCGHSERVARIAVRLGRQMQVPAAVLSDLYLAGLLHDIGKIGVPDHVLLKPGQLNAGEEAVMRQHVTIGDRILAKVKHLAHLRPGVRNHHERYDGQGYPDRLAGANIPQLARILAVADACDAMMSSRPYRASMPPQEIDVVMRKGAGLQWDPNVVEHFLTCRNELYPICQRGLGDSALAAVQNVLAGQRGSSSQERLPLRG